MTTRSDQHDPSSNGSESYDVVGVPRLQELVAASRLTAQVSEQSPGDQHFIPTWELTTHWLGITPTHLRRILKAHPELPQGQSSIEAGMRWFTPNEARVLQRFLNENGRSKSKIIKSKPDGADAHIISVANCSSRSGKTSIVSHLAMQYAKDGYKTLLVDLDPIGTLTKSMIGEKADHWTSIEHLLLRSFQKSIQSSNIARIERGEPPLRLAEEDVKKLNVGTEDYIIETLWADLSLIPSDGSLNSLNRRMLNWSKTDFRWKYWKSVTDSFSERHIQKNYDVILFDHSSYESLLSTAALMASDTILIPATSDDVRTGVVIEFLKMLSAALADVETQENTKAEALGQKAQRFGWDGVHIIPSEVNSQRGESPTSTIPTSLLPITLRKENRYIDALGRQLVFETPFFFLDQRKIGRDAYMAGCIILDELYTSVEYFSRNSAKWRTSRI